MSTLKVGAIRGVSASSDAITVASDGSCTANVTNNLSNRNLIINGSQIIDQRNGGAAVTVSAASQTFITDRFLIYEDTDGVVSAQQSTTAPDGFTKSLKIDCTTADTSLAASQRLICETRIEGNNIANLGFGSSAAKNIILSFYVRSNLTGTFGGVIKNSGESRVYIFSYTISSADTWERKSITIPGDTTGTWLTTNGTGITINWGLALGSNWTGTAGSYGTSDKHGVTGQLNLLSSTSNEWLLTGVQFEIDSGSGVATDFEHRSFAEELTLCHRYYYRVQPAISAYFGSGFWYNSNSFICHVDFPVLMRANVTALEQTGTASHYKVIHNGTTSTCSSVPTFLGDPNNSSQSVAFNFSGSGTQGQGGLGRSGNASAFLGFSAEL